MQTSLIYFITFGLPISSLIILSTYLRFVKKLSIPAQVTRLIFNSFYFYTKYFASKPSDPSLIGLSLPELSLMKMMDILIGRFDSKKNQVSLSKESINVNKPKSEILKEIVKFRATLPEGIHQSKQGPYYFPNETIHFRNNHENPKKKNSSIYFNFHNLVKSDKQKDNNKRIGFLHFHGGGYMMGEPSTCYMFERLCSTNGYDLLGVDYSLYPENTLEEAIEDAFKAYEWFINEKKVTDVIIIGESAGGHLAIMLADKIAKVKIERNEENDSKVRGVVAFSPMCNVDMMNSVCFSDTNHPDRALPNQAVRQFKEWGLIVGFNQEERAKMLSPVNFSDERMERLKLTTNRYFFSYSTRERLTREIDEFINMLREHKFEVQSDTIDLPFHCFQIFCDFIPDIFSKLETKLNEFVKQSCKQD
ncbi:hypothetical protein ABK040_003651 [Willaertia magna]